MVRGGGMLRVGEVEFVAVPGEIATRLWGVCWLRTGLGVVPCVWGGCCFCPWEVF